MRSRFVDAGIVLFIGSMLAGTAFGQTGPATRPAAPAPAADRKPIQAVAIEVVGDVKHRASRDAAWTPAKVEDTFAEGTEILTGVRSSIKLRVGDEEPFTCMLIESVGLTILSEAAVVQGTKRVRVGVGYGRVRAGVAEGGLPSDFTVESPAATLSKRGTWNFSLYYERGTDHFEIALLDRGLVDALNRITGESREIKPMQLVDSAMRRWLDQAQILRNVPVPDILGQGEIEIAFNRIFTDGLGVTAPGQGRGLHVDLTNDRAVGFFRDRLQRALNGPPPVLTLPVPPLNPRLRPEAFFGTGRGDDLVEVLISDADILNQKGLGRPGRYLIRRAAAETWLRQHR